jgi:L-fuculose-phosphate aldolase
LAIYKKRSDIKAVLHAHPPLLIAESVHGLLPDIAMMPYIMELVQNISSVSYEMPGSSALGDKISAEFARGINAVVLERHGVVIGASALFEAFRSFETLCVCSRIQRNARVIGGTVRRVCDEDVRKISEKTVYEMPIFTPASHSSEELLARRELCEFVGRAYEKQFIMSGNGAFSCRLADGSVLITPAYKDRRTLQSEDMVLMKNGKVEGGKLPCATWRRHLAIYENDPCVQSVMEATPPYGMAFAVTEKDPDSRILPDMYISLRRIRKYPLLSDERIFARDITVKTPVAMIENDCVLSVGTSLLQAFDKLEMLENCARVLTDTLIFGKKPVGISSEAFWELERAFKLS